MSYVGKHRRYSYEELLKLGNLAAFLHEYYNGLLPEPRCSCCGNGVPVCAELGLPHADSCVGFDPGMHICWVCEKELFDES